MISFHATAGHSAIAEKKSFSSPQTYDNSNDFRSHFVRFERRADHPANTDLFTDSFARQPNDKRWNLRSTRGEKIEHRMGKQTVKRRKSLMVAIGK